MTKSFSAEGAWVRSTGLLCPRNKKLKAIFNFVDAIKPDNAMMKPPSSEVLKSEILSSGHV